MHISIAASFSGRIRRPAVPQTLRLASGGSPQPLLKPPDCTLHDLVCALSCSGDEESDVSGGSTGTPSKAGNRGRGTKRPRAARTASAGRAPRSHVATEQRRRDRINDGCVIKYIKAGRLSVDGRWCRQLSCVRPLTYLSYAFAAAC